MAGTRKPVASTGARRRAARAARERPVRFVTLEEVFEPMVRVRALADISGWADRERRVKWSVAKNEIGMLNEEKAREFSAKGYVEVLDGSIRPVSEDEAAEFLSTVSTVTLGGAS